MEDIVAKHETGRIIADKIFTDNESLCETVGTGLLGVCEPDAVVRTVT